MRDHFEDPLDSTLSQRARNAARPHAQAALDKFNAIGSPFWQLMTTPRWMANLLGSFIFITLSVRYLYPLLPGVTFNGTI